MSAVMQSAAVNQTAVARVITNYLSSMFVIWLGYVFYTKLSSYHINFYSANWRPHLGFWQSGVLIHASDLFRWLAWVYAVVLVPFYAMQPNVRSKASVLLGYVLSIQSPFSAPRMTFEEKQAALCLLLKFFFVPFVLNGVLAHAALLNNQLLAFYRGELVDYVALLLNLIFVVDFVPFVLGYLVEGRWLKNEIVSVDSSLAGWVACLLCYPPFNGAVGQFFAWGSRDHVDLMMAGSYFVYYGLNAVLVVLFLLYAFASVSLGVKCSNLTNRGVVDTGMYAVIRHPAYALKNLAWWLAALPVFVVLFRDSVTVGIYAVFSLAGWTSLYVMRAITEEWHMLRIDTGYAAYMQRVRWRFIPGIV